MFVKVYPQIFDSSIASNYEVRHVFEDFLKLADVEGIVDMTAEAIARRANMPLEKVLFGIQELMKPDPESRSPDEQGRRLVLIDSRRTWGWVIVNYHHYRDFRDAEALRAAWRDSKAAQRAKDRAAKARRKAKKNMTPAEFEKLVDGKLQSRAEELSNQHHPNGIQHDNPAQL